MLVVQYVGAHEEMIEIWEFFGIMSGSKIMSR